MYQSHMNPLFAPFQVESCECCRLGLSLTMCKGSSFAAELLRPEEKRRPTASGFSGILIV